MDEHRQLAAIMFTDIVGYTSMMSADESRALDALRRSRNLVRKLARRHRGRWLESIGDGNLVSFSSAADAVNCALTLHRKLADDERLKLRIGIHVGDIIESGGHIYGDGVNVASRIHALAQPGGIVVSEPVYDAVRNKSGIDVERLGMQEIRGLDHPIQVYGLSGEAVDVPLLGTIDLPGRKRWIATGLAMAGLVAALVATGIYTQYRDVQASDSSVAVLPFQDLSPDASNRYFSEGISEELINGLSRVPGLRVAGRTSAFAYGGREQDVREIGKQLNVSHVLDGSVRKAGNRVRISAQLVNADNGFQVWADSYDAEIDDIFAVQQNIGRSIVEALRLELMPQELANVARVSTGDVRAYDYYLQARAILRKANSRQDYEDAVALLEKALRRDPTFTEAEAARCEALVGEYNQTRDNELLAPAVETCNRALTMDDSLSVVHVALGDLYMTTGRSAFAVESYAKAVPLDPDNAEIYSALAGALMAEGRQQDAETYFKLALELSPDDDQIVRAYGYAMYRSARYPEAEKLFRRAIELDPEHSRYHSDLGGVLYMQGRFREASDAMKRANEIDPYDKAYNNIGTVLFFAGEFDEAVAMFRKAVALTPEDARLIGGLADACRMSADCDEWRELYQRAVSLTDRRLSVNPDDARELALKGVFLAFLEREEQGRQLIEQALNLAPEDVSVLYNAAIFWSRYGNTENAIEAARKAKSLGYPAAIIDNHPDILTEQVVSGR